MHREGAPEQDRRLAVLAEGKVTEALAGEGAEVMRISGQGLAAVGDGTLEVLREKADGRSLVPAFDELGRLPWQPASAGKALGMSPC